ncbi:SRPBCC domain-containing protein [Aestuariivirga litoralis]|uniref:SRPBCC domain-containing protein n=1 Tax=Aestuariivirga litoralis TaxID=2650924 RepID=A0A2W2BWP7_9HYPH|nr:SRPBCC domain-containing protein [Aestuariivirga litoralis]PZF77866.1 SRPBCC domain-containing protein [Aestuariivirga litoralis]
MDRAANSLDIRIERTIQATPQAAYAAWLDPEVPGTPWNAAVKLIMECKPDGLFYARMSDTPHYGRFIELAQGRLISHSWMSPYTEGQETLVTVSFIAQGHDTLMVLVHTGLPGNANGEAHREGWSYFMDRFPLQFRAA